MVTDSVTVTALILKPMLAEGSSPPPETDDLSLQPNLLLNSSVSHATTNGQPSHGRKRKRAPATAPSPAPSDPGSASGNPPELAYLFSQNKHKLTKNFIPALFPLARIFRPDLNYLFHAVLYLCLQRRALSIIRLKCVA